MAENKQDKILEALEGLVPDEAKDKISKVITSILDEEIEALQKEYQENLDEAYSTVSDERQKDWEKAKKGYNQAYDIINDLRSRLELQKEEFDQTIKEEYESAYQMLLKERAKNEDLESTLYEEFNTRLDDIKEFIVDKADEFLDKMGDEYYDMALKEALNDPVVAEHRVAFEKVLDVAGKFISEEDMLLNTNSKVENLERQVEQLEVSKRQLEAKNVRLMTENNKVQEYLTETRQLIEEGILNEQNARVEHARNVEGRGETVSEPEREVVIGEATENKAEKREQNDTNKPMTITEQWQKLAGIK